tara:strand:+ start:116 stop:667 length:552 start_codon:yes stop_codon:yes gene_type:complete
MKKKINRAKRIHVNPQKKRKTYGFIFIANNHKITTKKLKTNFTYLYYKNQDINQDINSDFDIIDKINNKNNEPNDILKNKYNLDGTDIIDTINIYNRVLKLYIVILKYKTEIPNFRTRQFIDIYKIDTQDIQDISMNNSVYNNIYNYSKNRYVNTYLYNIFINREFDVYIRIIDIYFYLIGYI